MSSSLQPQSFGNHRRFFPLYHYVTLPLLAIYTIHAVVDVIRGPGWATFMGVVLALVLCGIFFGSRVMALTAQDRIIRLEEELRMVRILPPDMATRTGEIGVSQRVGLRFASDEELTGLVERILSGELTKSGEIKAAIRDWRADHLRV